MTLSFESLKLESSEYALELQTADVSANLKHNLYIYMNTLC